MAKQKKAKKDKAARGRRGRAGMVYVSLMTVLMAVSIVLACTVFFRVEKVEVEGIARYTQEEILAVAGVETGSNLILTPAEQIEHRITEKLPYVDTAEAKKRFPTTLRLVIQEALPAAVVPGATLVEPSEEEAAEGKEAELQATGEFWIIDSRGCLLEKVGGEHPYIQVSGVAAVDPQQGESIQVMPGDQGRLDGLLGLLQALEKQGMIDQITAIDATLGTEIAMVYQGRVTVKLLNNTDFERKIRVFEDVVATFSEYDTGVVNLKGEEKVFYSPNL